MAVPPQDVSINRIY